jgi:bifunctional non-homologous end joining protein LigD
MTVCASSVRPDCPTLVREPFHRDGWVYEEKVDGWRMLAYKDGQRVRLVSRNGVDHTRRFADLAAAVAKLSTRMLVLDGEVAIFDQEPRSRFEWLDTKRRLVCRKRTTRRSSGGSLKRCGINRRTT